MAALRSLGQYRSITTNSGGGKTGELRYYPFGSERYNWGNTPTTYRFTGQRSEEAGIGLYFYHARWYDPSLGRLVQADTIVPEPGNPQAWDRYAYVDNNPIRYTDPSGHAVECGIAAPGSDCGDWTPEDFINDLSSRYGWSFKGDWTEPELEELWRSGYDLQTFVNRNTNGDGGSWVKQYLGNATFHHGNIINSLLGSHTVFWRSGVYLLPGFDVGDAIHELGHVLDNNMKQTGLPATWFGGGAADALMKLIEVKPRDIRWISGIVSSIPGEYQWRDTVRGGYGNTSIADYFAEAFTWTIYDPPSIPQPNVYYWLRAVISLQATPNP